MAVGDPYTTVSGWHESEFSVKGSRFVGISAPCRDDDALSAFLDEVRVRYPGATHYCYAAVIGGAGPQDRFSDNGEPSGTAGRPMLAVLRGSRLSDTAVAAVRYFGGTLLGTGGLVQAYTASASVALEGAERCEMALCRTFSFRIGYAQYGRFEAVFRDLAACRPEAVFAEDVSVEVSVLDSDSERAADAISELTKDRTQVRDRGVRYARVGRSPPGPATADGG